MFFGVTLPIRSGRQALYEAQRTLTVTREHVIRGYILSSAKIKRDRLIEPLRLCGIDPNNYHEEFDAWVQLLGNGLSTPA